MILFVLLCLAWLELFVIEGLSIQCGETVSGWYQGNNTEIVYRFTASAGGSIHPTTCELSLWDTHLEVRTTSAAFQSVTNPASHGASEVLAFSDDLGSVICPHHHAASAVTIKVEAGIMYDIVLRGGSNYAVLHGDDTMPLAYGLHLFCSEPLENYWSHMFAEVDFFESDLLTVFNGVWYYNHTSTCVGKGQFYGLCPFHFVHCAGHLTYGWGVLQAEAVVLAIEQQDHRYPNQTCSIINMPCTQSEYTCLNLRCIASDSLCDGHNDCVDGPDTATDADADGDGAPIAIAPSSSDEDPELCVPDEFGCLDPTALNYNPLANTPTNGSCFYCWWDAPVPVDLMTNDVPVLIESDCGVVGADLKLAVRVSQQYNVTQLSLVNPSTSEHKFLSEFVHHGQINSHVGSTWELNDPSEMPCWNDYSATIPWSKLAAGDGSDDSMLLHYEYPGQVVLIGYVSVASMEILDTVNGNAITRWVRSTLPFHIVYHTSVMTQVSPHMVEWNVENPEIESTFADIWVIEQATVIVFAGSFTPMVHAQIVLLTMVDRPLAMLPYSVYVDSPGLQAPGTNLTLSLNEDCNEDDSPYGEDVCAQKFVVELNLVDSCYFTGTYTVNFTVICSDDDSENECGLQENATETVTFRVESESVCPQVLQDVVAVGSSAAYRDPRAGMHPHEEHSAVEGEAFVVGEWAYFEIAMSSLDGLIVETSIDSIDLCFNISCSPPVQIYNRTSSLMGIELLPEIQLRVLDYPRGVDGSDSPLPNVSDIHMFLDPDVFNVPENDMTLAFQMRVQVSVLFYNTEFVLDWLSIDDSDVQSSNFDTRLKARRGNVKNNRVHFQHQAQEDRSLELMREKIDLAELLDGDAKTPDVAKLEVHVNVQAASQSVESYVANQPKNRNFGDDNEEPTASESPTTVVITNHSKPFVYVAIAGIVTAVVALAIVVYMKTSAAASSVAAAAGDGATGAAGTGAEGDQVNRILDFDDETAPQ